MLSPPEPPHNPPAYPNIDCALERGWKWRHNTTYKIINHMSLIKKLNI